MLNKKVLKDIQSLGLKKTREETGLFVAEGPKVVDELWSAVPERFVAVYATDSWSGAAAPALVHRVSESELTRLSQQKTPNQVLAVLRLWEGRTPATDGLLLYLDTIQDPGNMGTIIRIADWFGLRDIVCSAGCADRFSPKVVQATMASLARVNIYTDTDDNWLRQQPTPIYAAALHGKPLGDVKPLEKGVLVIGNESRGIRSDFLALATECVTIPRRGGAESLNAAVATGILLSHLVA